MLNFIKKGSLVLVLVLSLFGMGIPTVLADVQIRNVTSGSDIDGDSTFTTASITPAEGKLLLLTVASRNGLSTEPTQPTVSGAGVTWVAVTTGVYYDTTSASRRKLTMFRAMGPGTTGALTIDFGGQNQTHGGWILDELSDVDISGTSGSGAIVQSATAVNEAGPTSLTVTLAAFADTANATYGGFGEIDSFTATAGTGFTKTASIGTTDSGLHTEFKTTNDTGVDMSFSLAGNLAGIAVEIDFEAPVPSFNTNAATNFFGEVIIR